MRAQQTCWINEGYTCTYVCMCMCVSCVLPSQEKRAVTLLQQLNAIRNAKAAKRREQSERRNTERAKKSQAEEDWRQKLNKERRKDRYREEVRRADWCVLTCLHLRVCVCVCGWVGRVMRGTSLGWQVRHMQLASERVSVCLCLCMCVCVCVCPSSGQGSKAQGDGIRARSGYGCQEATQGVKR